MPSGPSDGWAQHERQRWSSVRLGQRFWALHSSQTRFRSSSFQRIRGPPMRNSESEAFLRLKLTTAGTRSISARDGCCPRAVHWRWLAVSRGTADYPDLRRSALPIEIDAKTKILIAHPRDLLRIADASPRESERARAPWAAGAVGGNLRMTLAHDQTRILEALIRHGVQFVVVGGVAAQLRGWSGATVDLDIAVPSEESNASRDQSSVGRTGSAEGARCGRLGHKLRNSLRALGDSPSR